MFTLGQVVPWGRSFDEYRAMFGLVEGDLAGRVLGCGDGPASFNAGAHQRGLSVISCDPIYQWSADDIRRRIDETAPEILEQTRRNQHEFVWSSISSVDELGRVRMAAMEEFLADYPVGRLEGRYVAAALPSLPFEDDAFDVALCSHFLFLYSTHLGADFHRAAVLELARVAKEVRVFPLLALGGQRSPFVDECVRTLHEAGCETSLDRVSYEFQRGANQMLRFARG